MGYGNQNKFLSNHIFAHRHSSSEFSCLITITEKLYICTVNIVHKKNLNLPVSNLKDKNSKRNQWHSITINILVYFLTDLS